MIRTVKRASHHNKGNLICEEVFAEHTNGLKTLMQNKVVMLQKPTVTKTPNIKAIKGREISHKLSRQRRPSNFLNKQSDY